MRTMEYYAAAAAACAGRATWRIGIATSAARTMTRKRRQCNRRMSCLPWTRRIMPAEPSCGRVGPDDAAAKGYTGDVWCLGCGTKLEDSEDFRDRPCLG